jgi:1,5-anhydro-D-fructose reductase (1,5-anhydro-D-mannitol-forming)
MSLSDVRWGFIGAGNVTEVKASPGGAFTQECSRVVAIARGDIDRAVQYAREHSIERAYDSVGDLCADPEVNAVYVCTPNDRHMSHALAAIEAGKHVLCEKPLALSTDDCATIVQAAERAGVILAVPYYRRFYPVLEALRDVVLSGRLGRLTTAQAVCHGWFQPSREPTPDGRSLGWRTRREESGGGTLTDIGSHRLDLLCWLLGVPRSVSAVVGRIEAWYDGEDQANVTVQFESGAVAHLDQSWCMRTPRDSLKIFGTEGQAIVDDLEGTTLDVQIGKASERIEVAPRSSATHRPVVADMVRVLRSGGTVRCSGADAVQSSQIIELAYRAANERRTLDVSASVDVR